MSATIKLECFLFLRKPAIECYSCMGDSTQFVLFILLEKELLVLCSLQVVTAAHLIGAAPEEMCHGEEGRIYVVSMVENCPVLQLDCTAVPFTVTKKINTGLENYNDVFYIPSVKAIAISHHPVSLVRAFSTETKEKIWELKGQVDGNTWRPSWVVHTQKLHRLIINDIWDRRLIVLDPRDGSHLQTVLLPETVYKVRDMCLQGEDLLVLLHTEEESNNKKLHVSYFSIA